MATPATTCTVSVDADFGEQPISVAPCHGMVAIYLAGERVYVKLDTDDARSIGRRLIDVADEVEAEEATP